MTESQISIAIALTGAAGQLFNIWQKAQIRAEILEFEKTLLKELEGKIVPRELTEVRHGDLVRRVSDLEGWVNRVRDRFHHLVDSLPIVGIAEHPNQPAPMPYRHDTTRR